MSERTPCNRAFCHAHPELATLREQVATLQRDNERFRKDDLEWVRMQRRTERAEEDAAVFREQVATLARERDEARAMLREVATCQTCNGTGEMEVMTGYNYSTESEEMGMETCAECEGKKIGAHVPDAIEALLLVKP
jgi:hypothetical protein